MIKTIITFIIVFGILVFVHEFGHYYFAKKSGILVREFSIGMGPKIFAYHKNSTTYTIRILPLGGYVRMAGMEDDSESLQQGQPVSLIMNEQNCVKKINTSQKVTMMQGLPLEVTNWDLEKELWIEGYVNGDVEKLQRFAVDHDALIIEKDGTELQIAPLDVQVQSATVPQRIMTNFAGAMNNFILAIVAFMLVAFLQGGVKTPTNTLGSVQENSVAQKAGLQKNDQIIAVDGEKTDTWMKLVDAISERGGDRITLTVKRHKQEFKVNLVPKIVKDKDKKRGQIGITTKVKVNDSILDMIAYGFVNTWNIVVMTFAALWKMLSGGFSLNDLGGPVAIYSYTSEAARYGVLTVINLMAVLSVNLGIFNLLPIPALDGGKILLNIIEGIRKKPIDPEKEGLITLIGFGFLLLLMVLVTWNDIQRFFFR
ncbi:RIP metalloprotease RseP [Ligilactobacillus ceti]|uniref:Zinc metalloprotease n=1 Tax=Ligilactobacillus ceti DSM 22408 TaxID=1122146 RepID=A0A0R2KH67_9LACO|nr:RIP metalloprotease RseP [Ligilactobacillus ceti]KRN88619.1 peptidase [Ligilactobacillus ceti DSM 22408]